nr:uncharacterized protein LOC109740717 [Aegilops tauschii subsp. strangulata]
MRAPAHRRSAPERPECARPRSPPHPPRSRALPAASCPRMPRSLLCLLLLLTPTPPPRAHRSAPPLLCRTAPAAAASLARTLAATLRFSSATRHPAPASLAVLRLPTSVAGRSPLRASLHRRARFHTGVGAHARARRTRRPHARTDMALRAHDMRGPPL